MEALVRGGCWEPNRLRRRRRPCTRSSKAGKRHGGQDQINALQKDMSNISTDGANQDATQMNTDCTTLSGDVKSAQGYGPIPEEQAQQHWGAALTDFENAASDCSAGTAPMDVTRLTRASGEIESGSGELGKASSRMADIGNGL